MKKTKNKIKNTPTQKKTPNNKTKPKQNNKQTKKSLTGNPFSDVGVGVFL